jgi:hypothetical protein
MTLEQREKILRRVASKRRAAKMRIRREEVGRSGIDIREVAAAATRDADFFREPFRVVDQDGGRFARLPRRTSCPQRPRQ